MIFSWKIENFENVQNFAHSIWKVPKMFWHLERPETSATHRKYVPEAPSSFGFFYYIISRSDVELQNPAHLFRGYLLLWNAGRLYLFIRIVCHQTLSGKFSGSRRMGRMPSVTVENLQKLSSVLRGTLFLNKQLVYAFKGQTPTRSDKHK